MTTRRQFLYGLGSTLGTVAFNALLQAGERSPSYSRRPTGGEGLGVRGPGHHAAKAKACIFLFMEGGPSHLDTFDPKPALRRRHLTEFQRSDRLASAMSSGRRYYVQSPFRFARHGNSGLWMCEHFEHLRHHADELCVYRGCQVDSVDHPTACYQMNTGQRFGGDPAVGAWSVYGLGTENRDLPAFVVLPEGAYPQGGTANWSNGFLPAYFQGTPLRPSGSPLLDLTPPPGVTRQAQRANLDLLARLNEQDRSRFPEQADLTARMEAYELAFRMQAEVPGLMDLNRESETTRRRYGLDQRETESFGRRCLLARRLVEAGVRFVQIFEGGWDSHDYLERAHTARIRAVDQPIAALLADLKARGLLESTLVVWAGEFGRSPDNGIRGGAQAMGRDHNARAMAIWLAGGGVRAGHAIGATDELGHEAVECVHHVRNFHVTLLYLLGLDDNRLTYFHEGRWKQLSQIGGQLIREIVA